MIRLTIVELAKQTHGGLALVEAILKDKEPFARVRHGSAAVWATAVERLQLLRTTDGGAVAARALLPRMTLAHLLAFSAGCVLVKVLHVAFFDRIGAEDVTTSLGLLSVSKNHML